MRRLLLLAVLALVPRVSGAATCASVAFTGQPPFATLVVDISMVGGFVRLAGEIVPLPGDPCPSSPLAGGAHLRGDGKAHFGLTAYSLSLPPGDCAPIWIDGVVDQPGFASGTGVARILTDNTPLSVVLTPVACPAIPD